MEDKELLRSLEEWESDLKELRVWAQDQIENKAQPAIHPDIASLVILLAEDFKKCLLRESIRK